MPLSFIPLSATQEMAYMARSQNDNTMLTTKLSRELGRPHKGYCVFHHPVAECIWNCKGASCDHSGIAAR